MATYTAGETVYVDERFVRAGEKFTTDAKPGKTWLDEKGNPLPDPLDHDGDGKKGGSRPKAAANLADG